MTLGDLVERPGLVVFPFAACSGCAVVVAVAPSFGVLAAGILAPGVAAVAAQVIVPLASSLVL